MSQEAFTEVRPWLHNQLNGAISFIVLSSLVVFLRCVGVNWKTKHVRLLGREEAILLASLAAFLSLCGCAIVHARAYLAYYSTTRPEELSKHYTTIYKASYALSVIYPIACALPKVSICCMYLGLFKVNANMRRATHIMIAFLLVNAVAWLVPSIAVCHPISIYWSLKPHLKSCIDYNVFGTWISLPHITSDLALLSLPLPLLWNMQMSRAKKIGLTITFLAGSIGIAGGCLRLAFYIYRTYTVRTRLTQSTKSIAGDVIVTYVEPGMYLIAACLPRLRSLITQLHATLSSSLTSLLARHQASNKIGSPPRDRSSSGKRHLVPQVDMTLTGQGNLQSLVREATAIN